MITIFQNSAHYYKQIEPPIIPYGQKNKELVT